jgi:hypothetical protein
MKFPVIVFMLVFSVFSGTGCSRYQIINETNPNLPPNQYKNIYVGWLDLDETKWKEYDYASIDAWKTCIYEMNVLGLQKFLKDLMPDKTVNGDVEKSNSFPETGDLYIKSTIIKVEEFYNYNVFSGTSKTVTEISAMIQFYDIKTKREIFNSNIIATDYSAKWGTIEPMLDAIVYNMACFMSDKLHSTTTN